MVFTKSVLSQRGILKLLDKNLINSEYIESQFIQHSAIPTYHFQSALPRLPIPELKQTCDRYLSAQRPLLIDESFRKTETNVKQFLTNPGPQLQQLLKEHDAKNKHTSYISELWFDMYLRDRAPLPLNYNPVLVFNDDPRSALNDRLVRTTNILISSLRFYKALKSELLEPEIFHLNPKKSDTPPLKYVLSKLPPKMAYITAYLYKAYPLDMSQYSSLFGSTRIPETDKDRLFKSDGAKHISVQYKGHFYVVDVLTVSGDILPADKIMEQLQYILSRGESNSFPIGVLTTLERNKWASLRHELVQNSSKEFKLLDTSILHLCLDDCEAGKEPKKMLKQFLHGDGENRWFDKSFSLIVAKDGVSAVNFEHSWGDGVAVLRYVQDIYKDSIDKPAVEQKTNTQAQSVSRLDFRLSDNVKSAITEAKRDYKTICDKLEVNYTIFNGIGKATCKKSNVSPDAIMQLGFQVAYHKVYNKFVATYESCSTAAFKHGRTEAIRPCTTATQEFAIALNSNKKGDLKPLIIKCSEIQNRLIKEAAMGQGFDRHLFALKHLAEKNGTKCNIFDDPEYAHLNYNILSTSTLSSDAIFAGAFGPVVHDGFGIGYAIKNEFLGVAATSYRDGADGETFMSALTQSFEQIFSILQKS